MLDGTLPVGTLAPGTNACIRCVGHAPQRSRDDYPGTAWVANPLRGGYWGNSLLDRICEKCALHGLGLLVG
eukprot:6806666-Prymnesium_polylepis.1